MSRTVDVELTWGEVHIAGTVGLMRAEYALRHQLQDNNGDTGTFGVENHFLGCLGEIAVAKHLGKYWAPNIGVLGAPDVGDLYVRTCSKVSHCLILHWPDPDDKVFINALVERESLPIVRLRGWLYANDGKQWQYWQAGLPRPAFFVPAGDLRPMKS